MTRPEGTTRSPEAARAPRTWQPPEPPEYIWLDWMRKGWLEVAERIYKEGYEQGFAQGEAERMILITLKLRGIEVPDAVLHRLRACRDLDQLKAWAKRAAHATDAADIFDGDGDCEGHGDIDGDIDGDQA